MSLSPIQVGLITFPIAAIVLGFFVVSFSKFSKSSIPTAEKMFFGQQFYAKELNGTTGKLMKLAVACDLTATIVPDLMNDGFVPYETSTLSDVDKHAYILTFWKRLSQDGYMRIITESDQNNMTCIISVSRNVKLLQEPSVIPQNDGESRDNFDGFIPL